MEDPDETVIVTIDDVKIKTCSECDYEKLQINVQTDENGGMSITGNLGYFDIPLFPLFRE